MQQWHNRCEETIRQIHYTGYTNKPAIVRLSADCTRKWIEKRSVLASLRTNGVEDRIMPEEPLGFHPDLSKAIKLKIEPTPKLQYCKRMILEGDVLQQFSLLEDESVDAIAFSPPYWGQRDYSVDGQIGLESDYKMYLHQLRLVMMECKRVLKKTGTCWVNIGDTYAGSGKGAGSNPKKCKESFTFDVKPKTSHKLKSKTRIGIPERFYIQCIDDGWVARNHVPWIKGNHMPSSVRDRLTNKWESIFFFAKTSETQFYVNTKTKLAADNLPANMIEGTDYTMVKCKNVNNDCKNCKGTGLKKQTFWRSVNYFFDLDSIRVQALTGVNQNTLKNKQENDNNTQQLDITGMPVDTSENAIHEKYTDTNSNVSRLHKDRPGNPNNKKQDNTIGADGKPKANYTGFNDRWKARGNKPQDQYGERTAKARADGAEHDNAMNHPDGKNPGDVMDIQEKIPKWKNRKYSEHTISKTHSGVIDAETGESFNHPDGKNPGDVLDIDIDIEEPADIFQINPKPFPEAHFATFPVELPKRILQCGCAKEICKQCEKPRIRISKSAGYSDCGCNVGFKPGIVLDPFFGAGTTGVAAEQLGIDWIGIELNENYAIMARKRIEEVSNTRFSDFKKMVLEKEESDTKSKTKKPKKKSVKKKTKCKSGSKSKNKSTTCTCGCHKTPKGINEVCMSCDCDAKLRDKLFAARDARIQERIKREARLEARLEKRIEEEENKNKKRKTKT